jgi:hypothetical protein
MTQINVVLVVCITGIALHVCSFQKDQDLLLVLPVVLVKKMYHIHLRTPRGPQLHTEISNIGLSTVYIHRRLKEETTSLQVTPYKIRRL